MTLKDFLSRCVYQVGGDPDHPTWQCWTLDYERIHQLVLKALFEDTPGFLSEFLSTAPPVITCRVEPEKQLYDLVVNPGPQATYFELKMWSQLTPYQIQRQIQCLGTGQTVHYVLLARAGADWSRDAIEAQTGGRSKKIGYNELIATLRKAEGNDLADAYRAALEDQRNRIIDDFGDPDT
jgi:hypothetical protein